MFMRTMGLGLPSRRRSPVTAAAPPPVLPVISLTSGTGYAGSVYASDIPDQWTADDEPIAGVTGTAYTMSVADEGKVIRCGGSNAIQMWTPDAIPAEYRAGGGWWSPRKSVQVSEGRIAGVPDQWGVNSLVQQTAADQPDYAVVDGGPAAVWPQTINNRYLAQSNTIAPAWWLMCLTLRDGLSGFAGYEGFIGNRSLSTPSISRVMGGENTVSLLGGTVWTVQASVNAKTPIQAVAPLSRDLIEFRGTPTEAYWHVGASNGNVNRSWRGAMFEWLCLGTEPAGDLLARIQGCIAHQQGIQAKLPASHPYRTQAPMVTS